MLTVEFFESVDYSKAAELWEFEVFLLPRTIYEPIPYSLAEELILRIITPWAWAEAKDLGVGAGLTESPGGAWLVGGAWSYWLCLQTSSGQGTVPRSNADDLLEVIDNWLAPHQFHAVVKFWPSE